MERLRAPFCCDVGLLDCLGAPGRALAAAGVRSFGSETSTFASVETARGLCEEPEEVVDRRQLAVRDGQARGRVGRSRRFRTVPGRFSISAATASSSIR